jgi:hypothetical protein
MDSLFGFINPKGEIITSPIYQEIDTIKSNIQAYWVKKDGKYGIIDAVGKVLINFGYDELIKTVDPTVYILKGYNKYGFLRPYDEYLINSSYDTLFEAKQPYTNSYLGENLYQIINADGDEVGQIRAGCNDGVGKFITYIAKMYGKYALINQNEQEITPFEYEDLYEVKGIPHYFAKINHKYGIMDKNGKAVIPYIYDSIYFDEKSSFKATLNNKTYHYDLKGNCLDCPKD